MKFKPKIILVSMVDSLKKETKVECQQCFYFEDISNIKTCLYLRNTPFKAKQFTSTFHYDFLKILRLYDSCHEYSFSTQAMTEQNGLKEYLDKCSLQIDEVVELIRGQLTKMARITLGALIVMDVHGKL